IGDWLTGALARRIPCNDSWLIGDWLTGVWFTGSAPICDWLIGVWFTGVWLTGVPNAASAWINVWLTGVWLTGLWLTGAPWMLVERTVAGLACEPVQSTPGTLADVHQSVKVPFAVAICESGSFPSANAIAGMVPSGLCDRSRSPIVSGLVAFGWSGA